MKTPTDEQIAKLPKWAQEHIADCHRERDVAAERLKAFLDSQTKSLIYTHDGIRCAETMRFIQSERVTLILPNGEITASIRDGQLEVMANGPCYQLCVMPRVTNVVHIKLQ